MGDVDPVPSEADVAGAAGLASVPEAVLHDDGLVGLREQVGLDCVAGAVQGPGIAEGAAHPGRGVVERRVDGLGRAPACRLGDLARRPRAGAPVPVERAVGDERLHPGAHLVMKV